MSQWRVRSLLCFLWVRALVWGRGTGSRSSLSWQAAANKLAALSPQLCCPGVSPLVGPLQMHRSHPTNRPHSRAHLTHLCHTQMLERKLLTGCVHLLCLKHDMQHINLILLTAYSSCKHSKLTQSVLEWLSLAATSAAAELIAAL